MGCEFNQPFFVHVSVLYLIFLFKGIATLQGFPISDKCVEVAHLCINVNIGRYLYPLSYEAHLFEVIVKTVWLKRQ